VLFSVPQYLQYFFSTETGTGGAGGGVGADGGTAAGNWVVGVLIEKNPTATSIQAMSTPLLHIQKHNQAVRRNGFCPDCRRFKSKFKSEIGEKNVSA